MPVPLHNLFFPFRRDPESYENLVSKLLAARIRKGFLYIYTSIQRKFLFLFVSKRQSLNSSLIPNPLEIWLPSVKTSISMQIEWNPLRCLCSYHNTNLSYLPLRAPIRQRQETKFPQASSCALQPCWVRKPSTLL